MATTAMDPEAALDILQPNVPDGIPVVRGKRTIVLQSYPEPRSSRRPSLTDGEIAEALIASIRDNTHLQMLAFIFDAENLCLPFLRTVLPSHQHIEELYLVGDVNLTNAHLTALATALKTNLVLTHLIISAINFPVDMKLPGGVIPSLKSILSDGSVSLTHLFLTGCNLGDGEVKVLAEGLQENNSLLTLALNFCHITDVGCRAIANALRHNKSLTFLDLDHNEVTGAGAAALQATLQRINYCVIRVDMAGNSQVSDEQRERINGMCRNNQCLRAFLQYFQQHCSNMTDDTRARALEFLKPKPDLIYQMLKSNPVELHTPAYDLLEERDTLVAHHHHEATVKKLMATEKQLVLVKREMLFLLCSVGLLSLYVVVLVMQAVKVPTYFGGGECSPSTMHDL